MSSSHKHQLPTLVVTSSKKKSDPLLDLLSMPHGSTEKKSVTVSVRTTSVSADTARKSRVQHSHVNVPQARDGDDRDIIPTNVSFDEERQEHMLGHGIQQKKKGLLDKSIVNVKTRRRLLKRSTEETGIHKEKAREENARSNGRTNLASLAARAGASAAHGGSPIADTPLKRTRGTTPKSPEVLPQRHSSERLDTVQKSVKQSSKTSPPSSKKQRSAKGSTTRRTYRRRTEASSIIVNGTAIPRVVGVPDHIIMEMASLAPADRPVRCGRCRSCENPARKKACEVIRALGANPPVPRGKNRLAILGPENMKKHVSRTCDGPPNITPPTVTSGVTKRSSTSSGDKEILAEAADKGSDGWTDEQLQCLYQAILDISPNTNNFWQKVASHVPNRDEAECFAKIHESEPYYSSNSKPKKGSHGSKRSRVLDPGADDYVSSIIERRRERALGHLASSRYAPLRRTQRHDPEATARVCNDPGENDREKHQVKPEHQKGTHDDIQMMLSEERLDDEKDSGLESGLSGGTWSKEY